MILREHTIRGRLRARAAPVIGSESRCDLNLAHRFGEVAVVA